MTDRKDAKANAMIAAIQESAEQLANAADADVLFVKCDLDRGVDDTIIDSVRYRLKRKNVCLILVTPGGDADVAYRIARCLQDSYERFTAFVLSYCKSAGTLCVLGANEIVMCDMAELGPLDVQLYKRDEIGELSSGLVVAQALQVLQDKAFEMFEQYFLAIKIHSGGQVTFKTATEIAMKAAVGLLEPLYKQIDPIQVGEVARSMNIATAYGRRLMLRSKNYAEKTIEALSQTYPSHGFVIDRSEAGYLAHREEIVRFLSKEVGSKQHENTTGEPGEANEQKPVNKKAK